MNILRTSSIHKKSIINAVCVVRLNSFLNVRFLHDKKYSEEFDFSKSFDTLDSSSFKTMENILQILHNAEEQVDTKKKTVEAFSRDRIGSKSIFLNEFSSELGMDIFEYRIIRFLNEKGILHDYPEILRLFPSSYERLVVTIVNSYKDMAQSYFKKPEITMNGELSVYQAITKSFIEEDSRCLKRLNIDIKFLLKNILQYSPKKRIYNFPVLKIPPPKSYDTSNPLMMMKAFNVSTNRLNLLPFIVEDNHVIQKIISEHQMKGGPSPDPPSFIKALMKSQEIEGGMIFSILTRKLLYKSESLNADLIINKFLNDTNLKAIIAHQSKIPSRLLSFRKFKAALSNSSALSVLTDDQITNLLASHFYRFFAVFYCASPLQCEEWLMNLLVFYNSTSLEEKTLLEESVTYFKETINDATFDTIKTGWTN